MASIFILSALVLLLLVLVVIAVALVVTRAGRGANTDTGLVIDDEQGKYPEGHWMSVGMGIGIALGMPMGILMGIVMDNFTLGIAIGPGIGVAFGAAIGSGLEQRHQDQIRPLTHAERRQRWILTFAGIAALVVGILVLAGILVAKFLS